MRDGTRHVGIDHVYVSVTDFEKSEAFYDAVMQALGFRKGDMPIAGERHAHYFTPRMQYSIRPAKTARRHDAYAPGLHHFCFQAPDRRAVDEVETRLRALGVDVSEAREYDYGPGYYAIFFEDPDGIRLEVVARRADRDRIREEWDRFEVFLNPLADLDRKRGR